MQKQMHYKNGQVISKMVGNTKTVFYKNGKIRAKGKSINGHMEGKWIFFRETGQLWVIGNFKKDTKHGLWVRYNRKDKEEYRENFADGKIVKSSPKSSAKSLKRS
jgi:antitoxin component YwqK of YwqJK toxin-antitoxin module